MAGAERTVHSNQGTWGEKILPDKLSPPRGPAASGEGRAKWQGSSSEELQSKMSAPSEPSWGWGEGVAQLCLDFPTRKVEVHLADFLGLLGELRVGRATAGPVCLPGRSQSVWEPQREAEPQGRGGGRMGCPGASARAGEGGDPPYPLLWSGTWGWESLKIHATQFSTYRSQAG